MTTRWDRAATAPADRTTISGSTSRTGARATAKKAAVASTPLSRSGAMSAGLARNWWAVGLRGAAAVLFALSVLILPPQTVASLVLLFTAYIAADGALAILSGSRAARRGARWWALVFEGMTNLAAGGILVWQAI